MVADFRGGIGRSLMGDSGVFLVDIGSGWGYISSRAGGTYISVFFLWVCWAPSKHLVGFGAIACSSPALKERLSSVRVGTCVRRRGQVAIT